MNKSLYQSDWSTKAKFIVSDTVRVKIPKRTFEKGYAQNYTDDLFVISKVRETKPITFHLKEQTNKFIDHSIAKSYRNIKMRIII